MSQAAVQHVTKWEGHSSETPPPPHPEPVLLCSPRKPWRHKPVSPQLRVLPYEVKCSGHRTGKTPAGTGMILKKKGLPNNKDVLGKERESGRQNIALCRNCSPASADVLHYAVGGSETWLALPWHPSFHYGQRRAVSPASCFVPALKTRTALICLVSLSSGGTKSVASRFRNEGIAALGDLIIRATCFFLFTTCFAPAECYSSDRECIVFNPQKRRQDRRGECSTPSCK